MRHQGQLNKFAFFLHWSPEKRWKGSTGQKKGGSRFWRDLGDTSQVTEQGCEQKGGGEGDPGTQVCRSSVTVEFKRRMQV